MTSALCAVAAPRLARRRCGPEATEEGGCSTGGRNLPHLPPWVVARVRERVARCGAFKAGPGEIRRSVEVRPPVHPGLPRVALMLRPSTGPYIP